jgi:hypothetical protein
VSGHRGRRPTVASILARLYRCRDEEGGCGARPGELCKTFSRREPCPPHADRWRQWEMEGSPGAWWHEHESAENVDPVDLARLRTALRAWTKAADGGSGDAEHEAALELARSAAMVLKVGAP